MVVNDSNSAAPAESDWWILEGSYRSGLAGAAEALFPPSDTAPDYQGTELILRTTRYVGRLPPPQRKLVKLLFIATELLAPILSPGIRRFSRRKPDRRRANVNKWRTSWFYPARLLADALKATLQMVYLSHPAVLEHIGEYKVSANREDTFRVEIRGSAAVECP
ncbi:MAG: hypothetical protein ACJAYU_002451 [Bradymonadia bacterium]